MNLSDNVTTLRDGERTIYLVGTAHVSQASVDEVNALIEEVRPDTVCIELCPARYAALTDADRWRNLDIFQVIREGKTLYLLANLAIASYQRRLGRALGVKPGAEMLAAAAKAEEIGAELALVDRDIHVTLKRTWASLSFSRKLSLLAAILGTAFSKGEQVSAEEIERLKERAALSEMMEAFAEELPEVKRPLIDERDAYMASKIAEAPGRTIVAVVGAGHVPGMSRRFGQPVDRDALEAIPPPAPWVRALKWIVPALIVAAFAIGATRHQGETLRQMLYAWILPNSIFAALFTAIAGARPLSVAAAFVASPITSLNPMLGAGMVVGLLEAWLRKPTVADAEAIHEDVRSLRGVYRNAFTRVLLVAAASTFGSALGAWIGLPWVLSKL